MSSLNVVSIRIATGFLIYTNALNAWLGVALCSRYCSPVNFDESHKLYCLIQRQVKTQPRGVCENQAGFFHTCPVLSDDRIHLSFLLWRSPRVGASPTPTIDGLRRPLSRRGGTSLAVALALLSLRLW